MATVTSVEAISVDVMSVESVEVKASAVVAISRPIDGAMAAAIVDMPDEPQGIRNLWITTAYSDLSRRLARVLDTPQDANWCTFAAWASHNVGARIRAEELRRSLLLRGLDTLVPRFEKVVAEVSDAVAEGNRLVFAEVAPAFVDFIARPKGRRRSAGGGAAASGLAAELDQAFALYGSVLDTQDPKERSERMLGANCLIAHCEQSTLQNALETAFAAFPNLVRTMLLEWGLAERQPPVVRQLTRRLLATIADSWATLTTDRLLELRLSDETLNPGRDVAPPRDRALYCDTLESIDDAEVRKIFDRFNRADDTGLGSATNNWTVLSERMGWVVCFIRSRQQVPATFAWPLREDEILRLEAGDVAWAIRGRGRG
jgi:hypothetical protein